MAFVRYFICLCIKHSTASRRNDIFVIPIRPLDGTPSKVMGLDGWPDHKIKRSVRFRVTALESALELCRQGQCVGYFPKFVVDLHNKHMREERRLKEFISPVTVKERMQSVYLVRRQSAQESQLERQIAKSLRGLN